NGHKVPQRKDIDKYLNETVSFLQKSEGITAVKKSIDLNNFILSVEFKFAHVSKLNNVISKLSSEQKNKVPTYRYQYNPGNKTFTRIYNPGKELKKEFNKLQSKDQTIFKTASHTSIFRFEQSISSSNNAQTKISNSGKAAMQTSNAMHIINGSTNLSQSFQLK